MSAVISAVRVHPRDLIEQQEARLLGKSSLMALAFLVGVAVVVSVSSHLRTSKANIQAVELPVIEAELVEKKEAPAKLYEKKAPSAPVVKTEQTVSKDLSKGKTSADAMKNVLDSQNQTTPGAGPAISTRGPQVESSPAPKIPSYLRNQNLKTNVLIEFLVKADGQSVPSLIGSSGNEELDALALKTAQSWIFRPAIKDGQRVDAKVRLRINFEVD